MPVVPKGAGNLQSLPDQLILSQPGQGADYAHQMIMANPDFQTYQRPCNVMVRRCLLDVQLHQFSSLFSPQGNLDISGMTFNPHNQMIDTYALY